MNGDKWDRDDSPHPPVEPSNSMDTREVIIAACLLLFVLGLVIALVGFISKGCV